LSMISLNIYHPTRCIETIFNNKFQPILFGNCSIKGIKNMT